MYDALNSGNDVDVSRLRQVLAGLPQPQTQPQPQPQPQADAQITG
ncbi:hypothetical protein [Streptomyces sp. NPDC017529]